jgi:hypothetical protein
LEETAAVVLTEEWEWVVVECRDRGVWVDLGVVLPWVGVEWAWTEEGKLVPLRKTLEI